MTLPTPATPAHSLHDEARPASEARSLEAAIRFYCRYSLAKEPERLAPRELFRAVALATRQTIIDRMLATEARLEKQDPKRVYYLSMEFLMGRLLGNNLCNLGLLEACREALAGLGADIEDVRSAEVDAALGNGGLGRLAACFLDSLASLDLPGFGYGINYEYGLFRQEIRKGYQHERADNWLVQPSPWLIKRPEETVIVPVYGHIEHGTDASGRYNPMWLDWRVIVGVPHDMPIVGHGGRTVNYLRLFSARASDELDMSNFNEGDYVQAVRQQISAETVSKVLYPSDSVLAGQELRIVQEYFLVACAVRDIVRRFRRNHRDLKELPRKVAIQLNDTHPALTVAELMRVLVDEVDVPWDEAWRIVEGTLAYTNHTLVPEALEEWPVALIEKVVPRHLQIIYEINHRFLGAVARCWPGDEPRQARMSIIREGDHKKVRMAHLSIVGSHSINGVSRLHSELVKTALVPDFREMWPEKFNNKTNGITHRRWLLKANPGLAGLITEAIGEDWVRQPSLLKRLEPGAADPAFQAAFAAVKHDNKGRLARIAMETTGIVVDPASLFDVQAKRIHEYKRQLLNVLHVIHRYLAAVEDGCIPAVPRTYIFAGKSAPGYWAAKQIIKLIHSVADVVNKDRRVAGSMRVVFLPDYRVSLAERIIPAADLSEQISTASMEASGTGNMKFAINGALTMGTLDGANVEIRDEVGEENIFIFGLTADEVRRYRIHGGYNPWDVYHRSATVRRVLDSLRSARFCQDDPRRFEWIFESLLTRGDFYFHVADLEAYIAAQDRATAEYLAPAEWRRKAILNVARMGWFSSDRTVTEYARDVWGLETLPRSL